MHPGSGNPLMRVRYDGSGDRSEKHRRTGATDPAVGFKLADASLCLARVAADGRNGINLWSRKQTQNYSDWISPAVAASRLDFANSSSNSSRMSVGLVSGMSSMWVAYPSDDDFLEFSNAGNFVRLVVSI